MKKNQSDQPENIGRRSALKVIASTAAAIPVLGCSPEINTDVIKSEQGIESQSVTSNNTPTSTPTRSMTDPDLLNPTVPWHNILEKTELKILHVLADKIIPRDDVSPGAGELDAHNYINEWVSAPYDKNKRDLILIRGGIVWLNHESIKRFGQPFLNISDHESTMICNDIKYRETAKPEFKAAARFFAKLRDLVATAFYTTVEGMADIGYVGNVPLNSFAGPPPEVLKQLGLETS